MLQQSKTSFAQGDQTFQLDLKKKKNGSLKSDSTTMKPLCPPGSCRDAGRGSRVTQHPQEFRWTRGGPGGDAGVGISPAI